MKYAQVVMGPAGAGKSTYCHAVQEHCATMKRTVRVVNLDPAAEDFKYTVAHDVRDLISVDDVMEELELGPNGGLVYCMEYLCRSNDWVEEILDPYGDDDYLIFDCPGQIELYSHVPVMQQIVRKLQAEGFQVCGVYLIDALSCTDAAKLMAGTLMALSAMINLEIPHVNVMSKVDLVPATDVEKYLLPDSELVLSELHESTSARFRALNNAFGSLIDDYGLVQFLPMSNGDEDSVELVLAHIDNAIQYGEDMEPREAAEREDVDDPVEMGLASSSVGGTAAGGAGGSFGGASAAM
uniref:GPN-loop GTPase 3 n=1 Tax=Bicosoecida sp. CB-2014 TaxID=1486930 RepID=A0A7S1C3J6_9STRA|mmetsp:Transcript_10838/g.37761  ORF Transcript_10838/g.37761 Transcript_10838/m.37761 type:complete len:296 (+) Transcript_10838:219-1106(+)